MTSRPTVEPTTPRGETADGPGPIVLRVVVDGPSTAGKTSTARALGDQFGREVFSPSEEDGRTLLFDWMEHEGGSSDGRPIRAQIVAVPGHLPHLRARLLVTADVVLFVADTSRDGLHHSRDALAQLRELLAAIPRPAPGMIVQANKRDLPNAVPMDEVHRVLGLNDEDTVIESVATDGSGVRQAFVFAVREGLKHVRASSEERIAERQLDAETLLSELDLDPRPTAQREAERQAERDRVMHHEMGEVGRTDEAATVVADDWVVANEASDDESTVDVDGSDEVQPGEPSRWRRWLDNR